ncbi:MAG: hypothetical protein WC718_18525 [Phycisphaerales bacterium]|jgi:hypothetical protein
MAVHRWDGEQAVDGHLMDLCACGRCFAPKEFNAHMDEAHAATAAEMLD